MMSIIAQFGSQAVSLAATLIVHSTCILLLGLLGLFICKRHMAYASLILRVCVVAVLLTPFSAIMFSKFGVIHFRLPGVQIEQTAEPVMPVSNESIPVKHDFPSAIKDRMPLKSTAGVKVDSDTRTPVKTQTPSRKPVENIARPSLPAIPYKVPVTDSNDTPALDTFRPVISRQWADKVPYDLIYSVFAIVWAALSGFMFLKILIALRHIDRLKKEAHAAKPGYVEACRMYSEVIGVTPPPILCSMEVSSAFLAGIFRPVIFLPAESSDDMISSNGIIVHELAHLGRKDTLWNMLGQAGKIMIPFQPLMWILDKQLKITSDFICDDIVLHMTKSRRLYAEQLYKIAEEGCLMAVQAAAGVGFFSVDSSFVARIERILDRHRPLSYSLHKRHMIVTVVFGSIGFVSVGFVGITANSNASIPKNVVNLTTQLLLPHKNLKPSPENDSDGGGLKISQSVHSLSSTISNRARSAYDSGKEPESPIIAGLKKENIQQIMESVDLDSSPIEFRFHAYEDSDMPQSMDFVSSIMSESEREPFSPQHAQSIGNDDGSKLEYEYDDDLFKSIAFQEHSIDTSDMTVNRISVNRNMPTGTSSEQTFKALEVTVPDVYEYGDLSDPERKKMSDIYRSLKKNMKYPSWSPDGNKIVFNDSDYGVWIVNAEGGEPQLFYDNYYKIYYQNYKLHFGELKTIGFSPDGYEIAFKHYDININLETSIAFDYSDNVMMYDIINPIPIIVSKNIATKEERILAKGAIEGSWSPDGKLFAYISENTESNRELWLLDLADDSRRMIECMNPSTVRFTPDSASVVVTENDMEGRDKITRINIHNNDIEELFSAKNAILSDISRDGRWILCNDTTSTTRQILYNTENGELADIAQSTSQESAWGRFSPDGTKICFNMKMHNDRWNIFIYDLDMPEFDLKEGVGVSDTTGPATFTIKGNFPNPFNMESTIEYSIDKETDISLIVYNSLGQKVRELVTDRMNAGTHRTTWDGLDDSGNAVSTGMYIAKLQSGSKAASLKMTVIK